VEEARAILRDPIADANHETVQRERH
jgi:hypothetical protein